MMICIKYIKCNYVSPIYEIIEYSTKINQRMVLLPNQTQIPKYEKEGVWIWLGTRKYKVLVLKLPSLESIPRELSKEAKLIRF